MVHTSVEEEMDVRPQWLADVHVRLVVALGGSIALLKSLEYHHATRRGPSFREAT